MHTFWKHYGSKMKLEKIAQCGDNILFTILILSSHLCPGLPLDLVPSGFPTGSLYVFIYPLRAIRPFHLIFLSSIASIFGSDYKLWIASLWNLFQHPVRPSEPLKPLLLLSLKSDSVGLTCLEPQHHLAILQRKLFLHCWFVAYYVYSLASQSDRTSRSVVFFLYKAGLLRSLQLLCVKSWEIRDEKWIQNFVRKI